MRSKKILSETGGTLDEVALRLSELAAFEGVVEFRAVNSNQAVTILTG